MVSDGLYHSAPSPGVLEAVFKCFLYGRSGRSVGGKVFFYLAGLTATAVSSFLLALGTLPAGSFFGGAKLKVAWVFFLEGGKGTFLFRAI